ncbi:hypothetical protein M758_3G114900 [Ceratodon purpureus]|uniref:Uncharacterized protein n=1 Tax=Ceratodon purpureus TaxID=3225 RepID=A0A8T0IH87_CERPU|nr:hypothetical protein KC19_3G113600 [Ceratodon purpureus]KAG0622672.1 hypothetical protein M758_3G114900 [Ceratodon purpureus]
MRQPCGCRLAVPLSSEVELSVQKGKGEKSRTRKLRDLIQVDNSAPIFLSSSLMRAVEIFPRCSSGVPSHNFSGLLVPVVSLLRKNLALICQTSKLVCCNTLSGEVGSHWQQRHVVGSSTGSKILHNAAVVSRRKKIAANKVAS